MSLIINIRRTLICYFIKMFSYTPCKHIIRTRSTAAPITLKIIFFQKILGFNRSAYWPVHFTSIISNPKNILIGIGAAPGLSPGCYIQGVGKIIIGDYTLVGPNVGIISANHDLLDYRIHQIGTVIIGNYCWLGMNSMILPNVIIGDHTIVSAGAVVTKSFPEGYCVLAGNPAKIIKKIDPQTTNKYKNQYEYYGYIPANKFSNWKERHIK